jgi:pimeloyl-ACP methyl ester carboxylesterase
LAVTLFTNTYNFCQPSATKPKIENAGVTIDFTDNGIGDTTLLFVHGWCINKTYWSGQVDYFKNKYRVVTMDLAGFGNSGTNRTIWTVEEFGKDVLAVIVALDLKNIILIGHSMSGEIILEAASHAPERVIGLIGIDNFTDVGKDVINQEAIDRYFEPFRNDFKKAGRSLRQNVNYLTKETRTLKALGLRVYLINSDKNPINKIGFDSNGIRYDLQIIDGTGHYPMIEKPTEFNLLLAKSLSGIAAGK